jgi:hypothetical protein
MIMKTKNIFLAGVVVLSFTNVNAQSPYVGIGFGYGLPIAGSVIGINSESNNPANTFSDENVYGSYGKGFNFGGYFGYSINDDLGAELGVNYLMGSKYMFKDNRVISSNTTDNSSDEIFSRSLRLTPSIRVEFGEGKISPYVRGGLAFGIMNKITDNFSETFTDPGTIDISEASSEYTGGVSVGFCGGLGMNITLKEKLFLFAELSNYYSSWAPNKRDFTKYTFNGSDRLGGMTTDEKHFEYVDKVDQTMNTSSGESRKELKFYFPMSSFGLNIGLHYAFGGSN